MAIMDQRAVLGEEDQSVETDLYPGAFDEMVTGEGSVRSHWRGLLGAISALPRGALAERSERARQQFADNGVTYNVYADARANDRPYRFDIVPLIIPADEWASIEAGIIQRAKLVEAVLADVYGPQDLFRSGALPAYLLHANPDFLRPWRYALGAGGRHLGLYVADLMRMPDGSWQVLADRTEAPVGLGLALENRRVLSRTFPEGIRSSSVRPLGPFFDFWQAVMNDDGASRSGNPRGVVLSTGPSAENYFEHIYMARQLGLTLTEGADLTSRDGRVFLKTLGGLQPVDVILRRINGEDCDPLELDGDSALGVTGLLDAVRAGNVSMINGLGSGFVETPALADYYPQLAQHFFGEDLLLQAIPRTWLGRDGAWNSAQADFDNKVIRQTWNVRAEACVIKNMDARARAELARQIAKDPRLYTAQDFVLPSVSPGWTPSGLQPRPVVLRTYVIAHHNGYAVLPGGLARVPVVGNPFQVSLQRGAIAKDVWVLTSERTSIVVPGPAPVTSMEIKRTAGELPSRAADNLYWLGRYTERLDFSARILRAALTRMVGGGMGARDMLELAMLAQVAGTNGLIETQAAAAMPDSRMLAAALTDHAVINALSGLFERTAETAIPVRDRFSADMWSILGHLLNQTRDQLIRAVGDPDRLLGALSSLLRSGAALGGMASENMTRGTGWRFFDLGRRVERAVQTIMALVEIIDYPGTTSDSALTLILELCDSTITYRTRYLSASVPGLVLDLVMADDTNPRAVGFQLVHVLRHLRQVPGTIDLDIDEEASPDLALCDHALKLVETIDYTSLRKLDDMLGLRPILSDIAQELQALSDTITRRHFAHVEANHAYVLEGGR